MSVLLFIFQGQRPYNDDSLLSESIALQSELSLEEIENIPVPDLNLTQLGEEVEDLNSLVKQIEEASNQMPVESNTATSLANPSSSNKSNTPTKLVSSTKRCLSSKKKRVADIK
jgi:hypothetical protein